MASDGMEADDELPALGPGESASIKAAVSYQARLNERIASLAKAKSSLASYTLEPVLTLSHASPVHSIAIPLGGHSLYSGGQDGFIRRYSLVDSLNGVEAAESSRNLIMKQAGSASGVLLGYWENADTNETELKWGPRSVSNATSGRAGGSPVFSMVVQSQELFGISGTQTGEMNLWTVRHDEGQIRHVFKSSADAKTGHSKTSVVSALCLAVDEKSFYSGGWDSRLLQWDLNTGSVVRAFADRDQDFASEGLRSNQVSSISLHPLAPVSTLPESSTMAVDAKDVDADGSPAADYDPLFDENNSGGEEEVAAGLTGSKKPPPAPALPDFDDATLPALSQDILLASSISGQVLIWDRRAEDAARRLSLADGTPPWAACACWSSSGDQVYVGRRDATVDVYDLKAGKRDILRLPTSSGPVSAIHALPGGRHLVLASFDTLRIYDVAYEGKGVPYELVPTYYGSTVSQLACDPSQRVLAAAIGSRGWSEARAADIEGVALFSFGN